MQIATSLPFNLLGLNEPKIWDTESAFVHLKTLQLADTKRTTERRLHALNLLPPELDTATLKDELGRPANPLLLSWFIDSAQRKRQRVLFLQLYPLPDGTPCLHANDLRGARFWRPIEAISEKSTSEWRAQATSLLEELQQHIGKDIAVFPHGLLAGMMRHLPTIDHITTSPNSFQPILESKQPSQAKTTLTQHLKRLEAESIHIIREAVAESDNPVMLYSIGKDSSVMLHLARKAFYPSPPPFPLMHVDTRWKFQEMYLFRDMMAKTSGMELIVHINPEAIAKDINPFDHGSALHTDITKTQGLKQALDHYKFDMVFGGARRDEEKSRAKERIFSFRSPTHTWEPKQQRPELWHLYNTQKKRGESFRVFPLSNWTELDIWQYIHHECIPVVPLYFAKKRAVVERDGMTILVDDDRFRLFPEENIVEKSVRFRTLGCYPLTGAIESKASTLPEIILELINARSSERQGRAIDSDSTASMEKKKQEGYF